MSLLFCFNFNEESIELNRLILIVKILFFIHKFKTVIYLKIIHFEHFKFEVFGNNRKRRIHVKVLTLLKIKPTMIKLITKNSNMNVI